MKPVPLVSMFFFFLFFSVLHAQEKQTFFEQHYFFDADDTMTRSLQVATEDVVDIQYSNLPRTKPRGVATLKMWDIL